MVSIDTPFATKGFLNEYLDLLTGLTSLLREHLAETIRISSLIMTPKALAPVGSQPFLRRQAGIDADEVALTIRRIL